MHGVQVFSVDVKYVHSFPLHSHLSGSRTKSKNADESSRPCGDEQLINSLELIIFNYVNYVKGLSGSTWNRQNKGSVRAFKAAVVNASLNPALVKFIASISQ